MTEKEKILEARTAEQTKLDFKPQVVLFDLCSTILDTMETDKQTLDSVLKDFRVDGVSDINKIKSPGKTLYNSADDIAPESGPMFRANYMTALMFNLARKDVKPFVGAAYTLELLKAADCKTGYISNRNIVYQEAFAATYPILYSTFDVAQHPLSEKGGFREHKTEKPNTEILEIALNTLNQKSGRNYSPSKDILFVGDAQSDILFAEKCGLTPVLFYSENANISPEFIRQRPNLKIVKNHKELQNLILSGYSKAERSMISFSATMHPRNIASKLTQR